MERHTLSLVKVYVTTAGEYSDYHITNVFRNREDAEAYTGVVGDFEEYEVREKPVERRAWHVFYWDPDRPDAERSPGRMGNPWEFDEPRDFDDKPGRVEHGWRNPPGSEHRLLCVQGWDRDRVLKVYSEQRTQELARREGIS